MAIFLAYLHASLSAVKVTRKIEGSRGLRGKRNKKRVCVGVGIDATAAVVVNVADQSIRKIHPRARRLRRDDLNLVDHLSAVVCSSLESVEMSISDVTCSRAVPAMQLSRRNE